MADVRYDEAILQKSVNRLYARADSIVASMAFLGVLLGGAGGFFSHLFAETMGPAGMVGGWITGGCILGGVIGYAVGESRAFVIRVQAQTMLVSMQIERNTRPQGHPVGGAEP